MAAKLPIFQLDRHAMWLISQYLANKNWIGVGRNLKIDDYRLDELISKHEKNYREGAYQMLLIWRESNPECTLQELFDALRDLRMETTIKQIKSIDFSKRMVQKGNVHDNNTTMRYIRCSSECKGCRGPKSDQCESYRNLMVPLGENITHENQYTSRGLHVSHCRNCGCMSLLPMLPKDPSEREHCQDENGHSRGDPEPQFTAAGLPIVQLDEIAMWSITEYLANKNWIGVGRNLNVPNNRLDEIDSKYKHDYRECALQMLLNWRLSNPKSTLQDLFDALKQLRMESTIEQIESIDFSECNNYSCR